MKKTEVDRIVGSNVFRLRIERDYSAARFATMLGITQQELLELEAGEKRIIPQILIKLCEAFQVELDIFFESPSHSSRT